ncbi:MAG: NAD(P)-dependent oxidoreductase [Terricaulis sp.]
MIFILGGNGFVGSAYARLLAATGVSHTVITRENYGALVGAECDVLINANGNSKKFLAARDPKAEFGASVSSVVASLTDFKASKYVYLSTGDVYPQQHSPEVTREDQALDTGAMSRYGLHKYLAEQYVRATHPNWLVFRMGGFVGPGMKKNAIFDILNGPQIWLAPDSELQFISTDTAARLVWGLAASDLSKETINLGSRGVVRVGDIRDHVGSATPYGPDAQRVRFELNLDKLGGLVGDQLPTTEHETAAFLAALR